MPIPVIDIFAGPGGLGEGFTSLTDAGSNRLFRIGLSVEKERLAHQTLLLRSFFRQFKSDNVPDGYYQFVRGEIEFEELFQNYPKEAKKAKAEAWRATLGKVSSDEVDKKISNAIGMRKKWVLIGGPPCQAYSIVGRSRTGGINPEDERVYLYREYYRILAVHNPPVFIMENVKGLLSAKVEKSKIFSQILNDLKNPVAAYNQLNDKNGINLECPGYKIFSFVDPSTGFDIEGNPTYKQHGDFVIKMENHDIPQSRHRVILLGIRKDVDVFPDILKKQDFIPLRKVLRELPRLRSGLSNGKDSGKRWENEIKAILSNGLLKGAEKEVISKVESIANQLKIPRRDRGDEFIKASCHLEYNTEWFLDSRLGGVCNHSSRGHMTSDLFRYLFIACFAKVNQRSPRLADFPKGLLPDHKNVDEGVAGGKFADRFRVQLENEPAKTITSHISKDGHYYIHPDPTQCRSLTVREAARIQTFPDNYFFCGPRTSQYTQVGNAVPPLLAKQIARIASTVLFKAHGKKRVKVADTILDT